jgi:hypothetical protein
MSLNVAIGRELTAAVRSHVYIAKSLGVVGDFYWKDRSHKCLSSSFTSAFVRK